MQAAGTPRTHSGYPITPSAGWLGANLLGPVQGPKQPARRPSAPARLWHPSCPSQVSPGPAYATPPFSFIASRRPPPLSLRTRSGRYLTPPVAVPPTSICYSSSLSGSLTTKPAALLWPLFYATVCPYVTSGSHALSPTEAVRSLPEAMASESLKPTEQLKS